MAGGTLVLTAAHNVQWRGRSDPLRGGAERPCTVRELDDGLPRLGRRRRSRGPLNGDAPPLPPVRFGRPTGSRAEHAEYRSTLGIRFPWFREKPNPRIRLAGSRQRQAGRAHRRGQGWSTDAHVQGRRNAPAVAGRLERWPRMAGESPARVFAGDLAVGDGSPSTMRRRRVVIGIAPVCAVDEIEVAKGMVEDAGADPAKLDTSSRPCSGHRGAAPSGSAAEVVDRAPRLLTARGAVDDAIELPPSS